MALLNNLELSNGLKIEDAYIRIIYFNGTEETLDFTANAYIDESAFREGKTPVASLNYSMDFDKNRNIFRQMYEHLIELPEYENAVEA